MGIIEILLILLVVGLIVGLFVPPAAQYRGANVSLLAIAVVVLVAVLLLT
jgi:hypothetical protein